MIIKYDDKIHSNEWLLIIIIIIISHNINNQLFLKFGGLQIHNN